MRPAAALLGICALAFGAGTAAIELVVRDSAGTPVANAMVTRSAVGGAPPDTSDNGYPAPGQSNMAVPRVTRFSDAAGKLLSHLFLVKAVNMSFQQKDSFGAASIDRWSREPELTS